MRNFIQNLPHPISNTLLMLRRFTGGFYEDGLFTITNSDFRKSDRFKRAYKAAKATGSFANWELQWRIHVLCWAVDMASRIEGDFVECGTDHGGTAMAVIEFTSLADLKKQFWLLDTFDGIDRTLLTGKEKDIEGGYLDYRDCFERVKANFAGMDFVNIIRGSVPSTLTHVTADKIAFMHIDMNATVPEIAALEHFWPRLSPFGVLLMDDYGWPRHREQKIGFDGFAKANGLEILQLPTGQGLIIKPPS